MRPQNYPCNDSCNHSRNASTSNRFAIISEVDAESESETESASESEGESEIEADGESEADIFPIYIYIYRFANSNRFAFGSLFVNRIYDMRHNISHVAVEALGVILVATVRYFLLFTYNNVIVFYETL